MIVKHVFSIKLKATDLNLSCKMRQNETNSIEETTTEREGRGGNKNQFISQWSVCSPWKSVSEDIVPAELKGPKEHKRNSEGNTDDEETTQSECRG